jgi:hypothetical protein
VWTEEVSFAAAISSARTPKKLSLAICLGFQNLGQTEGFFDVSQLSTVHLLSDLF